jgi:hypothetical protein
MEPIKEIDVRLNNLVFYKSIIHKIVLVSFDIDDESFPYVEMVPYDKQFIERMESHVLEHVGAPIGIPLSADMIYRLGFESDVINEDAVPVFIKDDFFIDFYTFQPIDVGSNICKYQVKYVHQLQNVYHAITCKELFLKP